MSQAGVDGLIYQDSLSPASALSSGILAHTRARESERSIAGNAFVEPSAPRRTPRKSLIVVLPDNHVVSADAVTSRMLSGEDEQMDVIVACAGQPTNLSMLQRRIRDLQILLAPAGTSTEDLRELAMRRAPGDIVTLLSGSPPERENG